VRAALVPTAIQSGEGGNELTVSPFLQQNLDTLILHLNDKAVGHTELRKTQRVIGLMCAVSTVTNDSC